MSCLPSLVWQMQIMIAKRAPIQEEEFMERLAVALGLPEMRGTMITYDVVEDER